MEGWTMVYTTTSTALASIKKHLLEENEISVVLLNQQDSVYNNFGEIKLYVKPDSVIRALKIIQAENE